MLAILKRGLHRAENTVRHPFRGSKREKIELYDFHIDWNSLKSFSRMLDKSLYASGPLKSAVDELQRCIGMFEVGIRGTVLLQGSETNFQLVQSNSRKAKYQSRNEYGKLGVEMNDLFRALSRFFDGISSITHGRVAQLARDIENETNLLQNEQLEAEHDAEGETHVQEVMRCYRRVRTILARFALNEDTDIWKIPDEKLLTTRLDSLPHSPAAQYRSAESNDVRRTGCTPNTRIDLLQQLRDWVHYNGGQRIYWLNGPAGTGKTTIAYSFCEQLESAGKLAASFFCSRQLPACRDVKRILPSISYQLSSISRPFRCALSGVLEDSKVYKLSLSEQLVKLVAKPLLKVKHTFPANMVIVIDALDECEDDEGVKRILGILLRCTSDLPVKFVITSRPSPTILNRMRSGWDERVVFELHLHEVDRPSTQEDIRTYLTAKLEPANLSEPDISSLVQRSGLLFIYATTIISYLGHGSFSQSTERLNHVLGASISSAVESNLDIDLFYTSILREAFDNLEPSKRDEMTLVLHTMVCAQEPLTTEVLTGLLKFDGASSVDNALLPLQSVLQVSHTSGLVTILHESFQDYMFDQQRSDIFYCDKREHHKRLAHACFDLIDAPSPPFNICKLESSYLLDREVPNIDQRVKEAISPELLYACRCLGTHVELAGDSEDLLNRLHEFLATRLLLWIEVLNLNRRMDAAISQLHRLRTWLKEIKGAAIIQDLAHDAWKFVVAFSSSPMSDSTPHIYVSMLPFWPEEWPVSKHYIRGKPALVKATGVGMRKRERASLAVPLSSIDKVTCVACSPDSAYIASGSRDKTIRILDAYTGHPVCRPLKGHTDLVSSVAYSPNGAFIVSASFDKTIRIWDAHTGQPVGRPLEGHTRCINSVAYSPNGAYIASGSDDKTIRIWDAQTGKSVGQPLKGHTDWVTSVAYSPNSAYIVSGSRDNTLRIWDAHAGRSVGQSLEGHTHWVTSITYSPNGSYVVSGSEDKTIRIWDAHTGQSVGQPLEGHTRWVTSVSYSPNGAHIVSGSDDKTIRIWDAHTGQPVGQPLECHAGLVASVAYSPNGAYIVSGSWDKTIRIWDTHPRGMLEPPAKISSVDPVPPLGFEYLLSIFFRLVLLILRVVTNRITTYELDRGTPNTLFSLYTKQLIRHFLNRLHDICVLLGHWTLNAQGWVVNAKKERLIWVPHDVRDILLQRWNTAAVSRPGSVRLGFTNAKLGEEWGQWFDLKQVPGVN
ncbi:hypothetical protein FRC10_000054 [Ceratobasidium sp. 414]|nr:hypothetical protein FRC10_000054 [Ceratobasidium sp. 414]